MKVLGVLSDRCFDQSEFVVRLSRREMQALSGVTNSDLLKRMATTQHVHSDVEIDLCDAIRKADQVMDEARACLKFPSQLRHMAELLEMIQTPLERIDEAGREDATSPA